MERIKQKWNVNTKEKTCLAGLVVLESEGEEWWAENELEVEELV